jgi:hypothetical protein
MELPMVAPAPVFHDHAVVCRALVEHHDQCRYVQYYLTGMIVLPNNSMANIRPLYLGKRRHIRFRLEQTTSHRQRQRESLALLDYAVCAHVGRIFGYVDCCCR